MVDGLCMQCEKFHALTSVMFVFRMLGNLRSEVASLRADNNELQDTLQSTEEQSRANTAVAVDAQE